MSSPGGTVGTAPTLQDLLACFQDQAALVALNISVIQAAIAAQTPVTAPPSIIESPTLNDITTTAASVALDLTGKVAGTGILLANVAGNGSAVVHVTWPGINSAGQVARSGNTPDGKGCYVTDSVTKDYLAFYGCSELVFPGGTTINISQPLVP